MRIVETKDMVKVDRLNKVEDMGSLRAFASLTIMNAFVVKGLKVVNGVNGLFVSMPSQKGKDDKYYDTFFPLTKEIRDGVNKVVLAKYNEEGGQ